MTEQQYTIFIHFKNVVSVITGFVWNFNQYYFLLDNS